MKAEELIRNERENLVLGFNSTMKAIKAGKLKSVVISTSVTEGMSNDIREAAEDSGIEVLEYNDTSSKLGTLCGRAHTVSVLGLTK